jgi:hypothetical protein
VLGPPPSCCFHLLVPYETLAAIFFGITPFKLECVAERLML